MNRNLTEMNECRGRLNALIVSAFLLSVVACNNAGPGSTTSNNNDGSGDETNALVTEALGYEGTITGKVADTQSTRESLDGTSSSQVLPLEIDTSNTVVRFHDLQGNAIVAPNGQPLPETPVNPDGSFTAQGVPVGTDFTVCVDIGDDDDCDVESCVNVPSDGGGGTGRLDGVRPDPLTTMVLAKLRRLVDEKGINLRDLPFSPAAVVARIVSAFTNLFEESGIEQTITLDEIATLSRDELADLFDLIVPANVRSGMQIVEGNLGVVRANGAEEVAVAAAEVFLRAGFPVADLPGPPDLSALAGLDGVVSMSPREFFAQGGPFEEFEDFPDDIPSEFLEIIPDDLLTQFPDGFTDGLPEGFLDELPDGLLDELPDDVLLDLPDDLQVAQFEDVGGERIYVSDVVEPDRNFSNADDGAKNAAQQLPVLDDFVLLEMARLHLQNRRITIGDLYDLLTSFDNGLGVRLTYFLDDPNFFGPPLNVFETADGKGKAIGLEKLFQRFFEGGFGDLDEGSFDQREGEFRTLLRELLGDTIPPAFGRLFDFFVTERLAGVDEFARQLREARAHLPFSRSGPSAFFVVADGDPFDSDVPVSPITIDAVVSVDGFVESAAYNEAGTGRFYLGFSERTENDGIVELILRETGRFLHSRRGPVHVSIFNDEIFSPVNGQPFGAFVSESGNFFPGTSVTVISDRFSFEPIEPIDFHEPFDESAESFDEFDELSDLDETDGPVDFVDENSESPVDESSPDDAQLSVAGFEGDGGGFGPNEQIFVLATGLGARAEPVRVDYDFATGVATFNPGGRNLLMFLPETEETGEFGLFNEDTGRLASSEDPLDFFGGPRDRPEDFENFFNEFDDFDEFDRFDDADQFVDEFLDGFLRDERSAEEFVDGEFVDQLPVDGPPDEQVIENSPSDSTGAPGQDPIAVAEFNGVTDDFGIILVAADQVLGLPARREAFTHVFGTEVPNERYDPTGAPYFDDVNGNGVEDADEPTSPFRPTLFESGDWRSTDIRLYYRRADNGLAVGFDEVAFDSDTPRTLDGVALVPRNYLPRLNAFRFGRPNAAINVITAFAPPEFFNGTTELDRNARLGIFPALAIINLVMDQVFNVEADIDIDGIGPLGKQRMVIDAHLFVAPIGDPFRLLLKGFKARSTVAEAAQ